MLRKDDGLKNLILFLIVYPAWSQAVSTTVTAFASNPANYITPSSVPGVYQRHARALGPRVTTPGNERITMTGTLTMGGQQSTITATYELPGKIRIQYGSSNRVAAYNGSVPVSLAGLNADDEALLEALAYDIPETFLYGLQAANHARILGFGFVVQGETGFGAKGDIYETTQTVKSNSQPAEIAKQFLFDSATSLLRRVSYQRIRSGVVTMVHTEYSQYSAVNGNMVPSHMDRWENGRILYDVLWSSTTLEAQQNDNAFNGQ